MVKISKATATLIIILILGFFLRIIDIQNNPKALYGDALTLVYDAYSILKTGHDQRGNFMPLVFPLGGSRPPVYVYADVPFVALFGPTALAARLPSVLSGLGIIFLLYLIGTQLLSKRVGLWAAGLAALSMWDLSLSREAYETHLALFLSLLGVYWLLKARLKGAYLALSAFGFGLSMHTYPTYKLTAPLLWLLLIGLYRSQLFPSFKKVWGALSLAIMVAAISLGLWATLGRSSEDRFANINIFNQPQIRQTVSTQIDLERHNDNLPDFLSQLFHNRALQFGQLLTESYLDNFLPDFLFLHGDGNPRHNPTGMGQLFWIDLVLIVLGIAYLLRREQKVLLVLTSWILISPLATVLVGGPHALRDSLMLPPLLLLAGLGAASVRSRWLIWLFGLIFAIQFFFFIDRFYFLAPNLTASFFSYPAKQAAEIAAVDKDKFDLVILSNDIPNMEFAYPTYNQLDPKLVIAQNQHRSTLNGYQFFQYGNVYIGSIPNGNLQTFLNKLPGKVLFVGAPEQQPFLSHPELLREKGGEIGLILVSR